MTPEQTSFVELCAQLRLLGANEVTHGTLAAKFVGTPRIVAPEPPPARDAPVLTEEQAREVAYAAELGRVPRQ